MWLCGIKVSRSARRRGVAGPVAWEVDAGVTTPVAYPDRAGRGSLTYRRLRSSQPASGGVVGRDLARVQGWEGGRLIASTKLRFSCARWSQ